MTEESKNNVSMGHMVKVHATCISLGVLQARETRESRVRAPQGHSSRTHRTCAPVAHVRMHKCALAGTNAMQACTAMGGVFMLLGLEQTYTTPYLQDLGFPIKYVYSACAQACDSPLVQACGHAWPARSPMISHALARSRTTGRASRPSEIIVRGLVEETFCTSQSTDVAPLR